MALFHNRPTQNRTWLPILLGVLGGMVFLCIFAENEPKLFERFTYWLCKEHSGKLIEPRSIHFTLYMLTLVTIGGTVGIIFSSWGKTKCIFFLLAILAAFVLFSSFGTYLDSCVWH